MTTVRLAMAGPSSRSPYALYCPDEKPALLCSYWYYKPFAAVRSKLHFRDWVLDSGAFSAYHSGANIDLLEYIDFAKDLLAIDKQLTEVYALDVIGDWRASLRNTETMWNSGVKAIPCYHLGEPWEVLVGLARDYPKVAIGGAVGLRIKAKNKFAEQCFAHIWPKKIHGFGFGSESSILSFPFHSCDSSNWEMGPFKYGSFKKFGNVSVKGETTSIRCEVNYYLALEKKAKFKWRREMEVLDVEP